MTPLPHALEATLSLLTSIRLDEQFTEALLEHQRSQSGPSKAVAQLNVMSLGVRQSYGIVLVRMVNGLVDPLQSGVYARSIAAIATQIGLPQWLVELRHAATHEDLPSLELLRSGAQEVRSLVFLLSSFLLFSQSLAWLLHNYFIPALSSTFRDQTPAVSLSPVVPMLKKYKSVMKLVTRDASLAVQYKVELRDIYRSLERWISEAKAAATSTMYSVWGAGRDDEMDQEKERWALERLCEALTEKDGLVPTSVK